MMKQMTKVKKFLVNYRVVVAPPATMHTIYFHNH